jgi:hypothetical protein
MIKNLYNNKEMYSITGEEKPRIQYWILRDVFRPADPGKGMGSGRKFSFGNLLEISVAQALTPVLSNVSMIAVITEKIRAKRPSFFEEPLDAIKQGGRNILSVLILSPNAIGVYIHDLRGARQVLKYLQKGFKIVHIDLDVLRRSLAEKIHRHRLVTETEK